MKNITIVFQMYKLKALYVAIVVVFFLAISSFYQNKVFSPHFVDEEDNFILGKYLLKNEKIYQDLFSHHQPLAYVFSAGIQEAIDPNSIYLLIKRHREAIIAWSFLWSVLLVVRFGLPLLLTITTFELTKIYLFGNLFLSESLAVYPLLYLTSFVIFKHNQLNSKSVYEYLFIGICVGLIIFLLSPLWPLVGVLVFLIFWRMLNLKKIFLSAIGFGTIALLILPFISIPDYINDAYLINFHHYIPQASEESWFATFIKALFSPIIALKTYISDSKILMIMKVLSGVFLINLLLLIIRRKITLLLIVVFVLGISNIRFVEPGLQYYSGFHILPWFLLLIFFSLYLSLDNFWHYKNRWVKLILVILILSLFISALVTANKSLFTKRDMATDFYINYSRQFDFGRAVNIMKSDGDTLFVVPDEWLIYWQGDIDHATKMINYYAWMTYVPQLNEIVETNFQTSPPTFFYCDCVGSYFGLEKYWNLYTPVKKDGKETKLLILKEKLQYVTKSQKEELKYYNFTLD